MSILENEVLMLRSMVLAEDGTNGGRMDNNNSVITGIPNNVWDSVFQDELLSGSTKYQKTFFKIANDDDLIFYNTKIWLDVLTPGDDWVVFFAGTQTDTQSGITGSEDCFGCSSLTNNVLSGVSSITVTVEDSSLVTGGADSIFRDGVKIRITNKDTPTSSTGTTEFNTINGTPSVSGNEVTIPLTTTLLFDYNVDDNNYGTRIMSVLESGDIIGTYSSFTDTTAGDGEYDDTTNPVELDSIGTIEQTVTLTFTDASNFTAASNVSGVTLTSGSTGADYSPSNGDVSKPYFTLKMAGFSGTWASGDTIVFTTHPASTAIWQKRVIPASCSSVDGNRTIPVISGEGV